MKKYIALIFVLLFLFIASPVRAQEQDLPEPGLTPDSPLYFLDAFSEDISLFFAFGREAKAQRAAEIAGEKAAEAKAMADAGNTEAAQKAVERYGQMVTTAVDSLIQAAQSGENVREAVAEVVAEATSIHATVLSDVYNRVPQQAKPAIERAVEQSERGATEALNALEGSGESRPELEEVRQNVQKRIEEARQQRVAPETNTLPDNSENIERGTQGGEGRSGVPSQTGGSTPSDTNGSRATQAERGGAPASIPGGRP